MLAAALVGCGDDGGKATDGASTTTTDGGSSTDGSTTGSSTTGGSTTEAPTTGDASSGTTTGEPELDPRLADCLRINACEADGGTPMGLQTCLAHALDVPWTWAATGSVRMTIEAMECKLAASDCETVRACTPAPGGFEDVCKGNPASSLCDGDRWVLCDPLEAPQQVLDCAATGQKCGAPIWGGCGLEPCEYGVTESTCDPDDPGVLIECDPDGFLSRVDCRTQNSMVNVNGTEGESVYTIAGEVCGFDPMRNANACIGTGEACGFFSQKCDGDVLETCAGGKLSRRDCASVEPAGQSCGFMTGGPFAGAASCGLVEPSCDLGAAESCEGGVIGFCDWDEPGSLDCVAAGYGGCATADYLGRTVAYCTP